MKYDNNLKSFAEISDILCQGKTISGQSFGTIDCGMSEYFVTDKDDKPKYAIVNDYRKGYQLNTYLFDYEHYDGFDEVKEELIRG